MTSANNDSKVISGGARNSATDNTTELVINEKPKKNKKKAKTIAASDDIKIAPLKVEKGKKTSEKTDEEKLIEAKELIESKEGAFEDGECHFKCVSSAEKYYIFE